MRDDDKRRLNKGRQSTERDQRGWKVPQRGTKSRVIYDMMVQGMPQRKIHAVVGGTTIAVGQLMYKIRNPDAVNARSLQWKQKRAPANGRESYAVPCPHCLVGQGLACRYFNYRLREYRFTQPHSARLQAYNHAAILHTAASLPLNTGEEP